MSLKDFKGAAYYFNLLMQQAQDEIDRGERTGARITFPKIIRKNLVLVRAKLLQIRRAS